MLCLCSVIFNISLSASNSFLEVCCAKKVGKRCFRYIEILTSRIHKYICIYIFRCLFYKPTVTTLVIFKDVTARCWQKSTACRHQILLVVINSPSLIFFIGQLVTAWCRLIGSFAWVCFFTFGFWIQCLGAHYSIGRKTAVLISVLYTTYCKKS